MQAFLVYPNYLSSFTTAFRKLILPSASTSFLERPPQRTALLLSKATGRMYPALVRQVFISEIWLLTAANPQFALSQIAILLSLVCLGMSNLDPRHRPLPLGAKLFFSGSTMKRALLSVEFISPI